ncbi:MAG: archaemetzincin family Zn-dependent metalloprotease [Candidatus Micrarchaeota archaeon]
MRLLLVEVERHFPLMATLKSELSLAFKKEIITHHKTFIVEPSCFNHRKHKWDGGKILAQLRGEFRKTRAGQFMVLGIFPYDMYVDSLNFVYGLAEKNGNYAIVSAFRLGEGFYGKHQNEKLYSQRILKEALHEVGHMMGLEHCKNKKCVMSFSPNILFVDKKGSEFCERCEFLL